MKSDASVRRAAFKEVARNPRLQRNLLDILSKHPGQQRIFYYWTDKECSIPPNDSEDCGSSEAI